LIIPYKADVPILRQPIGNYVIINLAAGIFAFQAICSNEQISKFALVGWSITGLVGHMWLHVGTLHVAGNLLFLWIFGNAVCSKVGNVLYPIIYIVAGLWVGIIHLIFVGRPMVGASGAIYAIIGVYLVLYPYNYIKCIFVFILYIRRITIAGFWIILLWVILNVLGAASGYIAKAYFAHLGGFFFGVITAFILTKLGVIKKDSADDAIFRALRT
jgi:membrane associated rhomboid family serine protease